MIIIVILSLGGVLFIAAAVLYLQNHEDTIARHGNAYHAAKRYPRNTALYLAGLKHEKRLCRLNQYHLQRKESENLNFDNFLQGKQKLLDLLEIESRIGRELSLREREKFQHQQFMFELQQKFLNSMSSLPQPGAILETRTTRPLPQVNPEYVEYEDVTPENSPADNDVHVETEPKDEKAKLWEAAVQAYRRKQKTKEELGEEAAEEISRDYLHRLDQESNDGY
ncbi:hypothetical protein IID10_11325 [candidate division KSB1 bacterium]|nr:hypothetical protein [candidate division KSB1 bacterium]